MYFQCRPSLALRAMRIEQVAKGPRPAIDRLSNFGSGAGPELRPGERFCF